MAVPEISGRLLLRGGGPTAWGNGGVGDTGTPPDRLPRNPTGCYRGSMKSQITKQASGLSISVEQVGDSQQALLDAFQECEEGRCSCKTSEYEKLDSIDVRSVGDGIQIRLEPRSGETIDESVVRGCLDYTLGRATKR